MMQQLADQLATFFKASKKSMQNFVEGITETILLQCKRDSKLDELAQDVILVRNNFCYKDYTQTPASTIYENSKVFNTNIHVGKSIIPDRG